MNNLNNEGVGNNQNDVLFINQQNGPPPEDGVRSKDILEISREFIPSVITVIIYFLNIDIFFNSF
jgi:predicted RNA-binding protein